MKYTLYFPALYFLFSCGIIHQEFEDINCIEIVIGDWQVYQIINPFRQRNNIKENKDKEYPRLNITTNEIRMNDLVKKYVFEDDCSYLIMEFNKSSDRKIYFKVRMISKDTVFLINRVLPHEVYTMKIVRIK